MSGGLTISGEVRALSLWQPWASLIAFGEKRIETRSWTTKYRGPIAVHAAKTLEGIRDLTCDGSMPPEEPFASALYGHGMTKWGDLPFGAIVAVADLTEVWDGMDALGNLTADNAFPETRETRETREFPEHEIAFGGYGPGRFGFVLERVRPLATPIPLRGRQGMWRLDNETAVQVMLEAGRTAIAEVT